MTMMHGAGASDLAALAWTLSSTTLLAFFSRIRCCAGILNENYTNEKKNFLV
jgi:hypothetical protein